MTVADLEQVMEIAASLPDAPRWPQSAYLKALNPIAPPRRIALVAAIAAAVPQPGDIHGFAVASLLPPQAELETIAVAAASQRRGLGQRLFDGIARVLGAAGVGEMLLEVRASNRSAQEFYRSLGFVETGRRLRYYDDPVEDAIVLRLPLACAGTAVMPPSSDKQNALHASFFGSSGEIGRRT